MYHAFYSCHNKVVACGFKENWMFEISWLQQIRLPMLVWKGCFHQKVENYLGFKGSEGIKLGTWFRDEKEENG